MLLSKNINEFDLYLDVLEGRVRETTLAPFVAVLGGAIDEVLFTQRNQFSSFAKIMAFESPGGGKCPTRPAVTLQQQTITSVFLINHLEH